MKIQADDLFNLIVVLVIAGATGVSIIAKALRARKEQGVLKPAGRHPRSTPGPVRQPAPRVDEILQEILGEDSLRSRLRTSRAEKKREQESERTEQGAEEMQTVAARGKYVPRFAELKSRFDEPAAPPVLAGFTAGKRTVQPAAVARKMRTMSRTELQQAIVLREILGPPAALR
jgi:hypothetical protein